MAIIYPDKNENFKTETIGKPTPNEVLSKAKKMGYPLDIENLIKEYRIKIGREDMEYSISGYIEKREKGWFIGVNKYHTEQRQRFTLAHEFAHYILHRYIFRDRHEDIVLFRTNTQDPIERAANDLASEILIPKEKFREYLDSGIKEIGQLSEKFNVSIIALRYKAYKLGYLNRV